MEKVELKNPLIQNILDRYKTIWALNHLSAIASWDLQTYMPKEGVEARGEAMAKVSVLSQKIFLEKEFVDLIKKAQKEKNLNDYEKAIVRVLTRALDAYTKLPPTFLEKLSKATTTGHSVWAEAKKKNDFSLFATSLTEIVELVKEKAKYLGYKEHPYDSLLDEFEEGLTVKDVEKYFEYLKPKLIALLDYIKKSKKYRANHPLENEPYDAQKMHDLNLKIISFLHYNSEHLRLDLAPHPFTMTIGKGDFRITTRHAPMDFSGSYGSTIHEYGHALYDIQCNPDLAFTPIGSGSSMVIHESQSRFWENFVGTSKNFLKLFDRDIISLGKNMSKFSIDDVYAHLNGVRPSLIRTESDELTYHFHILIRFEIEKALLEGKLQVKDVPKTWKDKYKQYLGVEPKNDSEGVLQDVHWSEGLFGYFPTYSIGTALSAMWKHRLEKELGSIDKLLTSKEGIRKIQDWLKDKVHQYGSTYTFKDLVRKSAKEEFSAKYLIEYLEAKYKNIY